ncbi:MAG: methyl-accepting chemotaxis protein, partial [Polyangiaceae bacterium]
REILDDISSAIRAAVSITEKGAQAIDSGLAQVKTSGEKLTELSAIVSENSAAMREINAAVGQQNAGIAQIFRAVNDQNSMMGDTVARLAQTDQAIQTLSDVSDRLVQIVGRFHI